MSKDEKKPYFGQEEEDAVLKYITTDCATEKNRLYNDILIEPFRIMTESILRRYPTHIGNYDIEVVESNALSHLIENMVKFKPFIIERKKIDGGVKWVKLSSEFKFTLIDDAKDMLENLIDLDDGYEYRIFYSRAYSYCQTIIRNYYIDHSKKSYAEKKNNLCFDDYIDELDKNGEYNDELGLSEEHKYEKLINKIVKKISARIDDTPCLKKNEIVVGDAIVNVLKNWDVLFMEETPEGQYDKKVTNKFAKNKILLYLKEQTGLSTKEIRTNIKQFKEIYYVVKTDFFDD